MIQPDTSRIQAHATRVLVVDDDVDCAVSTRMLLNHAGYTAQTVSDSGACHAQLSSFAPDVVLLDIAMPHVCGYDVARQIRALPGAKKIVIIAISGFADFDHMRRAMDAGCDEYLVKPVDFAVLEAVLAVELKKRRHAVLDSK